MPQILVTGTTAANPNPISAKAIHARMFIAVARKGMDGMDVTKVNVGIVTLGHGQGMGAVQPLIFNPGDERTWNFQGGMGIDLSRFYFNVANDGDGLVIVYE